MLQVKQVSNDILSSNSYVVLDDDYDYCWLVDIGSYEKVKEAIPSGMEVKGVFLTHTHFDHIYGINCLYESFPQCRVFTSEYGYEALYDSKKNLSFYHESPLVYRGNAVKVLKDEESVNLYPTVNIVAHTTPGHCPSCMTFVLNDWVFSGDSFIPGTKVVTKLPKGDRFLAEESAKRILYWAKDRLLCPGHGEVARLCI